LQAVFVHFFLKSGFCSLFLKKRFLVRFFEKAVFVHFFLKSGFCSLFLKKCFCPLFLKKCFCPLFLKKCFAGFASLHEARHVGDRGGGRIRGKRIARGELDEAREVRAVRRGSASYAAAGNVAGDHKLHLAERAVRGNNRSAHVL